MRYKTKKTLKKLFVTLFFVIVLVLSFGFIKNYIDGMPSDAPGTESAISVYVDGERVDEEKRIYFTDYGDSKKISVKYTKSHKLYDQPLQYTFAVNNIIAYEDTFGDENYSNVTLTSVRKAQNDFYLQISNYDGSFIFTLLIDTSRLEDVVITLPDLIFYL